MKKGAIFTFLTMASLANGYPTKMSLVQNNEKKIYFLHERHTTNSVEDEDFKLWIQHEINEIIKKKIPIFCELSKEYLDRLKKIAELVLINASEKEILDYSKEFEFDYIRHFALYNYCRDTTDINSCDTFRNTAPQIRDLFSDPKELYDISAQGKKIAEKLESELNHLIDPSEVNPIHQAFSKFKDQDCKTRDYLYQLWQRCRKSMTNWGNKNLSKIISALSTNDFTKPIWNQHIRDEQDGIKGFIQDLCDLEILFHIFCSKSKKILILAGGSHCNRVIEHLFTMKHLDFNLQYQFAAGTQKAPAKDVSALKDI